MNITLQVKSEHTGVTMERRRDPRVLFQLPAESTAADSSHNGILANFSQKGMFKIIHNG
jgi:hypothetical protein